MATTLSVSRNVFPADVAAETLLPVLRMLEKTEQLWVFRQWVTEGLPHAFFGCPLLYEALRDALSNALGVNAKDIFVVGSSKLGFSLSPRSYGRPFRPGESDLDLTIVNENLFSLLKDDFSAWKIAYEKELIKPASTIQRGYWDENLSIGRSQIGRGFIDYNKVPSSRRFENFRLLNNTLYQLSKELALNPDCAKFKKTTARVYKSWDDYFRQARMNIDHVLTYDQ